MPSSTCSFDIHASCRLKDMVHHSASAMISNLIGSCILSSQYRASQLSQLHYLFDGFLLFSSVKMLMGKSEAALLWCYGAMVLLHIDVSVVDSLFMGVHFRASVQTRHLLEFGKSILRKRFIYLFIWTIDLFADSMLLCQSNISNTKQRTVYVYDIVLLLTHELTILLSKSLKWSLCLLSHPVFICTLHR